MKSISDAAMAIVCLSMVVIFRALLGMDDFPQG